MIKFLTSIYMIGFLSLMISCRQEEKLSATDTEVNFGKEQEKEPTLTKTFLHDKIMGCLLGSALGDAMGAPTEMWDRKNMMVEYGHITGTDTMVRAPSPEGTWAHNLPAGGTTDDTRWKILTYQFLHRENLQEELDPKEFADFILKKYQHQQKELRETDSLEPEPYEVALMKMSWLQEWAVVAHPYTEGDLNGYLDALSKFYGGEPTCAGMLYSPAIGSAYPAQPVNAYLQAYRLSIFDQGYARDLSAITAAMVSEAMSPGSSGKSILSVFRDVDPKNYFKSRLVGRSAYRIYREALYIMDEVNQVVQPEGVSAASLLILRRQKAYDLLDEKNQDLPFHPGEIMLINLVGLMFGNFEVMPVLEFIVNYGRDNDTVAAIAGAILGALHGAAGLPESEITLLKKTNLEKLGIDLEQEAIQIIIAITGE
jgi:hypothetical protein